VKQGVVTGKHRFVFVGGLHKSGTSLVARCLAEHPLISGFSNTGVPEDEGQHLQTVFLPASAYGGPGKFGFHPQAHLTEASELVTDENRTRLQAEWGSHWDLTKPVFLEKSPPNLIRTRFLQALFPEASFVIVMRDPVAVAYATQKWSRTGIDSLIEHWLVCHEIFERDRPHIRRLCVVRYEDIVEQPQPSLDRIFSFLDVDSVTCGIEVRPEVNAVYLQRWREDTLRSSTRDQPDVLRIRQGYEERAAAFGYQLGLAP
jgi:hypothetical protein